ncbi:ECF RNA polymerase sigma factor SigK [Gordonia sp. LSe1-13]|uniref:ECF RNA polymerase sigma factor SigK n=1 Tax=Gordonia sesuvii TaxID=3116777 RepID=A0ABU7MJ51_9ACTN|nr:ECF RNA polymerase sigma factor SigK [Gordonia sp. LSe1-13]
MYGSSAATDVDLAQLLRRIGDGDQAAFADFYDGTCQRVYGMVHRVLRDDGYSEETTQEVYLQVWRSARTYDPDAGSALAWLLTMAHRRAVDRVRSESASSRRANAFGIASLRRDTDEVIDAVESLERRRDIRDGLGSLTALQRESVELAYFHGLTYREVAERLGIGLPTVKSRIRDGMRRLRAHLEPGRAA